MDLALLALYNVAAAGAAVAGLHFERRGRPRLGFALLALSLILILNLLFGGALLFVPVVLSIYGAIFGLPALGLWLLIRRLRRGRAAARVGPNGEG